jgi:hypothetical protein
VREVVRERRKITPPGFERLAVKFERLTGRRNSHPIIGMATSSTPDSMKVQMLGRHHLARASDSPVRVA